jgi:hypothetical protein
MNKEIIWKRIRSVLCVFFALSFWILSMIFSQAGFGITVPQWAWAGWILAGGVTVLELVLNSGDRIPPTLLVCGAIAYVYGISTNIFGILAARTGMSAINFWDIVLSIVIGLIIEIIPEPLFLYGLGINLGDLITNLVNGKHVFDGQNRQRTNVPKTSVLNSYFTPKDDDFGDDLDGRTNWADGRTTRQPSFKPTTQKSGGAKDKVRSYIFRNTRPGMDFSSREVAKKLGLGKSAVAEVMREMRKNGEIK